MDNNNPTSDPYNNNKNNINNMSMEDHHHHHHPLLLQPSFDHTLQWPLSSQLLSPPTLLDNPPGGTLSRGAEMFGSDQDVVDRVVLQDDDDDDEEEEELGAMKEMMFKIAAMQPVEIDPATIRRPRRRNVRISEDPQSVAARHRRERISEKIRILQRLVPGGTKMDTASMLDEAIRYVKFLKRQVRILQGPNRLLAGDDASAVFSNGAGDDYQYPMCFNRRLI